MKNQRHINRALAGALSVITVVMGLTSIQSEPAGRPGTATLQKTWPDRVPGQILVQYRAGISPGAATYRTQSMDHMVIRTLQHTPAGKGPMQLVGLRPGVSVDDAIAAYKSNPDVEYAQPNFVYRASVAPNDASYSQLWGMHNTNQTVTGATYATNNPPGAAAIGRDIGAESAWGIITDCSSATVAVIDSGVNYNHEDLSSNMVNGSYTCPVGTGARGCDFVGTGSNDPMDYNGHGTHVAGTIAAVGNNSVGVAGVCWKASLLAVRVMNAAGIGTTSDIVEGVNFAAGTGAGQGQAKVINMSLGGGSYDTAFNTALTTAQTNGVVVVVAAGNGGADGVGDNHSSIHSYPCDYSQGNILCVAAADQAFSLASFSDFSSTYVDIAAPGTNILSSYMATTTLSDSLSSGWTTSPVNAWSFSNCDFGASGIIPLLGNPGTATGTTWCGGGTVGNNRSDVAYKSFDLSSYSVATLHLFGYIDLTNSGDIFDLNVKGAGGDPFSSGTNVFHVPGSIHTGGFSYMEADLYGLGCMTANCSIGFRLTTDGLTNTQYDGVALAGFSIDTRTISNTAYGIENGTSMASPHVAGIATMVRARNPNFTYSDTVQAILTGGTAAAAFTTTTVSGKVANAYGALKYIPDTTLVSVN